MSHDFQNHVTLTEEQYSCLLSRIASLEKRVEDGQLWRQQIQRWLNIAPSHLTGNPMEKRGITQPRFEDSNP